MASFPGVRGLTTPVHTNKSYEAIGSRITYGGVQMLLLADQIVHRK